MKIGLLGARLDNGGLGIQTHEWYKHVRPNSVFAVRCGTLPQYGDRYYGDAFSVCTVNDGHFIPDAVLREWMRGLDVVVAFETPYNPNAFNIARELGVKSVLVVNWEYFTPSHNPDLFVVPTAWHLSDMPANTRLIETGTAVEFRKRDKCETFLVNAGNCQAFQDRNGFAVFLRALPMVRDDARFVVKVQDSGIPRVTDPRVEWLAGDWENFAEVYELGDVFVMCRHYGGLSLPMQEAMAAGLPVVGAARDPENAWPLIRRVPVTHRTPCTTRTAFDIEEHRAEDLAAAMNALVGQNIAAESLATRAYADAHWSWARIEREWREVFEELTATHIQNEVN